MTVMKTPFYKPIVCPVLIDRVDELAILHVLIDQAKSERGHVALLSGEAGVGKSRLVAETKAYAAAQDFLLLQGNCFQADLSSPYAPLIDLLRSSAANQLAATIASDLAPFGREWHQLLPDVVPLPTNLVSLSSPDPEQEKRLLFTALAQFFTGQATKQPVLLIIEDIHWSDETSLEFLYYLARRCTAQPLLIFLTYRSEEVRPGLRHFLAQLDREHLTQEILLNRLTHSEVDAMLRAIVTLSPTLHLELPDLIYALTEGNPFFVEEILKSLTATGDIFFVDGYWERKPLGEWHIPRSVQDAVLQRTDSLSEPARHVLILAAVVGRRFDFALLQQLTQHDESQLLSLMKELIAAQLVVEESEERFAFRHALTRQAVYVDLLVRERKAMHRTVSDTMERLYAPLLDAHLADLAYHFYEAGAWEQALEYGQRAGEAVQAMYASRAAIEQFTRALDATIHLGRSASPKIYQARGQSYEILGEFEHAHSDFEQALEIARSVPDHHAEWQSLIALGFLWAQRDYIQAGTCFQQALELARHMDDPLPLAHSLNRLGNWHVNIEQPYEALRYHQEALTMFQQAHDSHGVAETYDLLGMTATLGGDLLQGTAYYQQAIVLFQELDNRQGLASSLATLMVLGEGGGYEIETMVPATTSFAESLHFGELALQTARDIGQRSAEAYALLALAQYLGPHGEYMRALEAAQASLAISEQIEHRQWLTGAHWQLGVLYLDLLALPDAQQHLERALALAHEIGSWNWICIVSGFLAQVYQLQHDFTRAETILNSALTPDAPSQTIGQRLAWAARAELALARSDPDLALDITNRLIASAANLSNERVIPRLWKLRGDALAELHRTAEAETMLRAAQDAAHAQGLRPWLWRIAVSLGNLYRASRRQEEAGQAFAIARIIIEELAANVPDENLRAKFLSSALPLLPRPHPLTPRRATRLAFGGLTEREREVAILLAEGKSNREIAERLVVGIRTVEVHVSSILSKLGFTSRAQIAVWAHEKGLANTRN
jgi:tetratricopeptide (TPR) repeat protein